MESYPGYLSKPAKILAVLQLTFGIVILAGQIILLGTLAVAFEGFSGIWASPFMIMAGGFGLKSSMTKSKCTVITTLVMSVLAIIVSFGAIVQGIAGALATDGNTADFNCLPPAKACMYLGLTVHGIMAAIAILEFFTAILAVVVCSHCVCCTSGAMISEENEKL